VRIISCFFFLGGRGIDSAPRRPDLVAPPPLSDRDGLLHAIWFPPAALGVGFLVLGVGVSTVPLLFSIDGACALCAPANGDPLAPLCPVDLVSSLSMCPLKEG
jgi:hypothetical protein